MRVVGPSRLREWVAKYLADAAELYR